MDKDIFIKLLAQREFKAVRSILDVMNEVDIASLLSTLSDKELALAFRLIPKDKAAEVFSNMDTSMQTYLVTMFTEKELKELLDDLYMDDTVDMLEELPANLVKRILATVSASDRSMINQLLNYPEDSAGSIMTTEYVDLREEMTVGQAMAHIKKTGIHKETIYTCYVTDSRRKLLGLVSAKVLLLANEDDRLEDIMETHVIYVSTLDDQEEVANQLTKYNFIAMPVVDQERRLVGIVTFDDAMEILQEETTEDIEKMAAITPSDKPYLRTSVFKIFGQRIPWLLILMISATFTGMIISSFEDALAKFAVLTAFIPMLMDTGGNSGSQASVTVIRGLSLHEIEMRDIFKIIWKEVRIGLLCGVTLAVVNFGKIMLVDRMLLGNTSITPLVAVVVCLTLVATVFLAKLVGCVLPIVAKRIGFDPAVMASPFITTIVDALSLMIYLQVATVLLGL